MSMGMAFDDFAWFDAELADSEGVHGDDRRGPRRGPP